MNKKGFTLIEMIVALGVFGVAAVLGVSSYLSLVNAQKKAITLQTIQDNVRFTMEKISRNLAGGSFFYCGSNVNDIPPLPLLNLDSGGALVPGWVASSDDKCDITGISGGGPAILFFMKDDQRAVLYRLNSCGDHQCVEEARVEQVTIDPPQFIPITSTSINVDRLTFYITGAAHGDHIPGLVTFSFKGVAKLGTQTSDFILNTSVVERQYTRGEQ